MDHERVREDFVDRLTGNLAPERSRAIDEHLASCAECRAETERLREMWAELGNLRAPAAAGGAGRVGRLVEARAIKPAVQGSSWSAPRIVLATAALVAAVGVGWGFGLKGFGMRGSQPPVVASQTGSQRYVLLLHGPAHTAPATAAEASADSVAEQKIVAEYRAWAGRLRASGSLVMAEKLADDPVTMLAASGATELPHDSADELGGFFLIQVADSAEAFRIARECPHLKYGGTVQVRRIQPT
jgi:hypothetical protein